MTNRPTPQLTHFALFVQDLPKMEAFYTQVMGMTVTDRGQARSAPVQMVFLSSDPAEHHQFVLVSGRPDDVNFSLNQQMSFLVDSLDELRDMRDRVTDAGIKITQCVTHGNAWSIYFNDPEGNRIENYVHTPWYIPQPHSAPLDLDRSNAEIMAYTEAHCREYPGFLTRADRERQMAERMEVEA